MTSPEDLLPDLARRAAQADAPKIGRPISADACNAVATIATVAMESERTSLPRLMIQSETGRQQHDQKAHTEESRPTRVRKLSECPVHNQWHCIGGTLLALRASRADTVAHAELVL